MLPRPGLLKVSGMHTLGLDSAAAKKVAIACSTGGCGTVPPKEQLEQLPGDVVVFYDRNDPPNSHQGKRPGDE